MREVPEDRKTENVTPVLKRAKRMIQEPTEQSTFSLPLKVQLVLAVVFKQLEEK